MLSSSIEAVYRYSAVLSIARYGVTWDICVDSSQRVAAIVRVAHGNTVGFVQLI